MKLEKALYQKSFPFSIVFIVFVVIGFWVSYFSSLFEQENYRMHLHGMVMVLWCLLLAAQAYLVRKKKFKLHKQLGKTSYLLVPLIVFTTIDLFKFRLSQQTEMAVRDYMFVASVLNALFVFVLFYGLAIYFKNKPTIHARFMICTVFATFTAIIDRIIYFYFPSLLDYCPKIGGEPVAQVYGLTLGDILLLLLCIWDWKSHKRLSVFPFALGVHLLYHYSVLNFYKFEFWKNFGDWFFKL